MIKNFVLIETAELEFGDRLNVLSGETGAGKSILVDAVMLLLGARYDKGLLRHGADSGAVEGFFSIDKRTKLKLVNAGINDLAAYGIDENFDGVDEVLISRKFFSDGKNEIRLNGKQITLAMLKSFSPVLIDIYGQHDYVQYLDPAVQLRLVDFFVGEKLVELVKRCGEEYRYYLHIQKELKELGQEEEREKTIDFLSYQISEIENAKVGENEEEELVARRKILLNSEKISSLIEQGVEGLNNLQLGTALSAIKRLQDYAPEFEEYSNRLNSIIIEADDILAGISHMSGDFEFEKDALDKLEDRLLVVRNIKKKYGDYKACEKFLGEAVNKLNRLKNATEEYERLLKQKTAIISNLHRICQVISDIRRENASVLSNRIVGELRELGMEKAKFEIGFIDIHKLEDCEKHLTANGFDIVEFLFSANAGQPLKPFSKVASGGEMSRFMLAIKVVSGDFMGIDTLIFDEIDAGISGKVGQEVAKKLARIAKTSQVLCVTHLAQIASMADTHFFIDKVSKDDATFTKIELLNENGQIDEISRLLGSIGISKASHQTAKDMKDWSREYKGS